MSTTHKQYTLIGLHWSIFNLTVGCWSDKVELLLIRAWHFAIHVVLLRPPTLKYGDIHSDQFLYWQIHFETLQGKARSRNSSVGIATSYVLDEQGGGGSSSPGRVQNVHFSVSSRPALGSTQPPINRVPGALSRGVKQQESEADHSPPTSAEVKKMCIYTSTPQ
jgi:hypothetical protein